MNSRIQALVEQSGIFKPNEFHQHIDALQLDKFAELIVRECAAIANQAEQQCQHPATQIMKHFGVQ